MGLSAGQRDLMVLLVGGLFALPFILFSMTGGFLADRFSKRSVTIGTKWMEVAVTCVLAGGCSRAEASRSNPSASFAEHASRPVWTLQVRAAP